MRHVTPPLVAVVAEDEPDIRELIRLVLEQSGFEVVLVPDGPAAIDAIRRFDPLLTTLDINMPGMDGFAVAKRVREFSQTYLIMITSLAHEVDVVRGFEAGADDYLVKPFRPRELRARADAMLRRLRVSQQLASSASPPAPQSDEHWAAAAAREFRSNLTAEPTPPANPVAPPTPAPTPVTPGAPSAPSEPYVGRRRAPEPEPYQPPAAQPALPVPPVQPVQPAQPDPSPYVTQAPRQPAAPVAPAASVGPAADHGVVEGNFIRFGGLAVDRTSGQAALDGRRLELSGPETEILLALLSTGQRVRSKADLVLAVRGHQFVTSHFVNEADKRAVDAHVASLKRKLGDDGPTPRWIETVRGVGYRLVPQ